MVNSQQLQKETSTFLNKEILAVGIFDVSLTSGKRIVAPAAAGLAAGLITKQIQKKVIDKKNGGEEKDDDKVKWVQRRKQVRQMVRQNHPRLKFVFFVCPF